MDDDDIEMQETGQERMERRALKALRSREAVERIYSPGRWFRQCRDFFKVMGIEESCVLSMLIDFYEMRRTKVQEIVQLRAGRKLPRMIKTELSLGPGWFYSKTASLRNVLNIKQHQHDRIIRSLMNMGVLQRQLKGIPACRFLFIDFEKLDDLIISGINQRDS